ncbi:MAG: HTH domain-containing protein [Cyclobacteriaceae bacterium]|nr:HTH domain-containing protein [Cyclobacteriaceae bacterium]MCX7637273.1 HTH domain-containing protein [Cyclobacteriaceae bacterium]MDW8331270.1 helix-turn-helix domain-containing protein [Cyclobacteriaceae bacterium]
MVKSRILELFLSQGELSVKEIVDKLSVSRQMVHLALHQLLEAGLIEKLGRPPKTVYRLASGSKSAPVQTFSKEQEEFLKENFLVITETGHMLEGTEAFSYWCAQRKLPVEKTLFEFIETKKRYEKYYNKVGLIDGMEKLRNTTGFEAIWLDQLFYLDFYAIERFGKTRLGTLLHYAKQGQNRLLMAQIILECDKKIKHFLREQQADAVGFVPPTIRRELQFMSYLQKHLNIALPHVEIRKLPGIIPVPQKSLSKIEERIRNAENTFAVSESRRFNHVVMIDDAAGSGATLNQLAKKMKTKRVANKVTGLALVGSFKGFDVITDV